MELHKTNFIDRINNYGPFRVSDMSTLEHVVCAVLICENVCTLDEFNRAVLVVAPNSLEENTEQTV